MGRALLLALVGVSASAHERGQAQLVLAVGGADRVGVVLTIPAADAAQLTGRKHAPSAHALAFDATLHAAALEALPGWLKIHGDATPCALEDLRVRAASTDAIRLDAVARCPGEPAELAFTWGAAVPGFALDALVKRIAPDGTVTTAAFDAEVDRVTVPLPGRRSRGWARYGLGAFALLLAAALVRRARRRRAL